jgi:hypothetical protein
MITDVVGMVEHSQTGAATSPEQNVDGKRRVRSSIPTMVHRANQLDLESS